MAQHRTRYLTALIDARDALETAIDRLHTCVTEMERAGDAPYIGPVPRLSEEEVASAVDPNVVVLCGAALEAFRAIESLDASRGPGRFGPAYRPYAPVEEQQDPPKSPLELDPELLQF